MPKPNANIAISLPAPSPEGLKNFLASAFINGIGGVLASRIVEKTGLDILKPEFNFEDNLIDISGLSANKIEDLRQNFSALKYSPALLTLLFSASLNHIDVEKILSHYKKDTEKVIEEDPYQMVEEVFKLSFFTADKLGKYLGISSDDPRRLRGALLTAVKIYAEKGSMFATPKEAISTASRITGIAAEKIQPEIENLVKEERLIFSHGGLYLPVYYKAEKEVAEKLGELIKRHRLDLSEISLPATDLEGHPLSAQQLSAIETIMRNPVTVITGGPGTGKTTTIRGIIQVLEDQDKEVVLAAPTGRAAKRLSDLAGREAKTLHRLLGYNRGRGYRNKNLDIDFLIIDEASMLEQVMFNHLLDGLRKDTKIILVGDTDQLPAIGAGDVLKDLIKSGTVPVVKLTENFRQKEGSMIAANAAAIKQGDTPEQLEESDFMVFSEATPKKIHDRLLKLVAEEIPAKYNVQAKDIQVVSPQKEGPLGANQLNLDIQGAVNPSAPEIKKGLKRFRLGDRVMQTANSSERKIYNGETGWISEIDPRGDWLDVTFYDGKISRYFKNELKELALAYATTVHKLQGSETDYLVMPMSLSHKSMLYRNLLYTGVSRAKKLCVLVGDEKAIHTAIDNPSPSIRNSNFAVRLRENLPVLYPNPHAS